MLPAERVIGESGLSVTGDRARVELRLPWYRSLPLSTVRIEKVAIDGHEIQLEWATFELHELVVPIAELEELTDRFWFVLDSAYVSFPAQLAPGSDHRVEVTIALFPPYIPGMRRMNTQSELCSARDAQ